MLQLLGCHMISSVPFLHPKTSLSRSKNFPIIPFQKPSFKAILNFIYTGEVIQHGEDDVDWLMRLLRASDEFCIDRIKTGCEERLCNCVTKENVHEIHREAERFRAQILGRYCEWVLRQSREDHMGDAGNGAEFGWDVPQPQGGGLEELADAEGEGDTRRLEK